MTNPFDEYRTIQSTALASLRKIRVKKTVETEPVLWEEQRIIHFWSYIFLLDFAVPEFQNHFLAPISNGGYLKDRKWKRDGLDDQEISLL